MILLTVAHNVYFASHPTIPLYCEVTLELAADYKIRILLPARQFPLLMCWLVVNPPAVPCPGRQESADHLLSISKEEIGDTSCLKLRTLFHNELVEARTTGRLAEASLFLLARPCIGSVRLPRRVQRVPPCHPRVLTKIRLVFGPLQARPGPLLFLAPHRIQGVAC